MRTRLSSLVRAFFIDKSWRVPRGYSDREDLDPGTSIPPPLPTMPTKKAEFTYGGHAHDARMGAVSYTQLLKAGASPGLLECPEMRDNLLFSINCFSA